MEKKMKYDPRRHYLPVPQMLYRKGECEPVKFDSYVNLQRPNGKIYAIRFYLGKTKVAERKYDCYGCTSWVLWRPKKEAE